MSDTRSILFRRTLASLLDTTIELSGGVLGSYFGMMMAALLESVKDGPAEQMQHSMWSGFGFGLVFWTFSLSFLNRVLIQGLSRSSLGKKFFGLELISVGKPITWSTVLGRWVMGFGSFGLAGAGYWTAFFDKEGRTFHDHASHTDVVPAYEGSTMSVEYREVNHLTVGELITEFRKATVARQPLAPVIPLKVTPAAEVQPVEENASLAEVIDLAAERARKTGTDDDSGSEAA